MHERHIDFLKKQLLDKYVAVGVPAKDFVRPFYIYGTLVQVQNDRVILITENGLRQILLKEILDIHLQAKR